MSMLFRVATENCRKANRLAQRNVAPVALLTPDTTSAAIEVEGAKLARICISGGPSNSDDSGYSTETELTDTGTRPLDGLSGNDSNYQCRPIPSAVRGGNLASKHSTSRPLQTTAQERFPVLPRSNASRAKGKTRNHRPQPEGTAQLARNKIWAKSRVQNLPAGSIFVRHLGSIRDDWTRAIFACNCEDHQNSLKRKVTYAHVDNLGTHC